MIVALQPGARIGILGGGQLGRMLSLAAARLGFDVAIYDPDPDCPAGRVSATGVTGSFEDTAAIAAFARDCDVVTYEFENVPLSAAHAVLDAGTPLRPGAKALEVSQDRLIEKDFLNAHGALTVAYRDILDGLALTRALDDFGGRGILKTRRFGYDGKGQVRVSQTDSPETALKDLGNSPAILEALAPFEAELSVLAARSVAGEVSVFPLTLNEHRHHILHTSTAPIDVPAGLSAQAKSMAGSILTALDYVGVLAIELFRMPGDVLLVNEIAPRVHNSGHWTMDAGGIDQFEQHIRAIVGWPLGDPTPLLRAEMTNLIGNDVDQAGALAAEPHARLHLYGKREPRPGRKMGHVTRVRPLA